MQRFALILGLGLGLTPACDDPGQIESEPVFIAMSADRADIRSEDGDLIRSVSPDELTITQEQATEFDTFDQLSAVPEDPQAICAELTRYRR